MSSWKISRLFVGLSDQGLRYGLRHGFRHGGVNSIVKRTFTTTRLRNCKDCLEPYENVLMNESSKTTRNTSMVSWERFHQLDKDVGILGTKMDTVQAAIKDLSKKVDTDIKDLAKKSRLKV